MKPLDIRINLLRKGYTLAEVGRKCGVSRQLVFDAIRTKGKKKNGLYKKVRKTIAEIIGRPIERIWPGNFKKAA